ncbi:MAG: hypothetical protein Q7S87_00825 [Agitococcus sp.]|nr:hypothetical protein [Agitococcus sp.]
MSVIQPTPSQAAVILKKFLAEKNLDIKLSDAQEALARMSGYTSFNVFTSAIPLRGPALETAMPSASPLAAVEGLMLFAVSGRYHGDDDDTMEHFWASEETPSATDQFKAEMISYGTGLNEDNVYITASDCLGKMVNGVFVFEPAYSPKKREALSCKKCSTEIGPDGYCQDETCPYHGWPQKVDEADLSSETRTSLETKYDTLKRASTVEPAKPLSYDLAGKSVKVYFEPHIEAGEGEAPSHCWTVITDEWIQRVQKMQSLCVANRFDVIEDSFDVPDWMDNGIYGIFSDGIAVTTKGFWFFGSLKHVDGQLETRRLPLSSFLTEVVKYAKEGRHEMFVFSNISTYFEMLDKLQREDDEIDQDSGEYTGKTLTNFDDNLLHHLVTSGN